MKKHEHESRSTHFETYGNFHLLQLRKKKFKIFIFFSPDCI